MPCPFLKDNYFVWLPAAPNVLNINGKKHEVIISPAWLGLVLSCPPGAWAACDLMAVMSPCCEWRCACCPPLKWTSSSVWVWILFVLQLGRRDQFLLHRIFQMDFLKLLWRNWLFWQCPHLELPSYDREVGSLEMFTRKHWLRIPMVLSFSSTWISLSRPEIITVFLHRIQFQK